MHSVVLKLKSKVLFQTIFFVALFLCVLSFSYEHVLFAVNDRSVHEIFRNLRVCAFVLFTVKLIYDIICKNIKIVELIVFILCLPLILFLILNFYDLDIETMRFMNITIFSLLTISGSDIGYRKIMKFVLITMIALYLSVGILYALNYLKSWTYLGGANNSRFRSFLGFSWADLSYRYMFIVFYYFYVRRSKISLLELTILFVCNLILFYLVGARFPFVIVNALLLIDVLLIRYSKLKFLLNKYIWVLPVLTIVIPLLVVLTNYLYNADNSFMSFVNSILSGRLDLGHNAITNYGVKIFGNYIEFVGGYGSNGFYDFVDSGFLNFLMIYGVVAYVALILLLSYFSVLICKKNDIYLMIIFLLLLLYSITDLGITELYCNYFLFVLSYKNSIN